jgi:hypothetical protein
MRADSGAAECARTDDMEDEAGKQPRPDMSPIFVDDSVRATLRYSEASVNYPTLREARAAWLALHPDVKKNASITTQEEQGALGNLSTLGTLGLVIGAL